MTAYLTAGEVCAFNERLAGPDLLADFGLLESAVMRPQTTAFGADAYPSIHEKAAALLHSLARNHPFIDGNKRTAWASAAVFYKINGYELAVGEDEIVAIMVDVAEGLRDVPAIAGVLKGWAAAAQPE